MSEDIRFVLKRRRRKRKHNVPVSNKQEVRETSKYFLKEANEISLYPIFKDFEGTTLSFVKVSFAISAEKWEEFESSKLFKKLKKYIKNQCDFQNGIPNELTKERAKSENVRAKEIFDNNLNPNVEDVVEEHGGRAQICRDCKNPATLEMVQYYYHLGNLYTDDVNAKSNTAITIAVISVIVSIASIIISLL